MLNGKDSGNTGALRTIIEGKLHMTLARQCKALVCVQKCCIDYAAASHALLSLWLSDLKYCSLFWAFRYPKAEIEQYIYMTGIETFKYKKRWKVYQFTKQ